MIGRCDEGQERGDGPPRPSTEFFSRSAGRNGRQFRPSLARRLCRVVHFVTYPCFSENSRCAAMSAS